MICKWIVCNNIISKQAWGHLFAHSEMVLSIATQHLILCKIDNFKSRK